jgi:flagellar motor switch protein FliM
MTDVSIQDLSRSKLRQLLAAVGSSPTEEAAPPEMVEYDWRDPHYFNEEQRNRLAAVMSHVAALMSDKFVHFFKGDYLVTPTSITQHFAGDLRASLDFESTRCLTLGPESGPPCGFLAVATPVALRWARQLLGDNDADDEGPRRLSSLEESLLRDLTSSLAEAFVTPLQPHHELHPDDTVSLGEPHIQFEVTEPVLRVVFDVKPEGDAEACEVCFLLSSRFAAPLAGKDTKPPASIAPAELSRRLSEHLYEMPVTVVAGLDSTFLSFERLLELDTDDILLFDKTVAEPVELIVEDRVVFCGRPVRSDGHYAVWITEATNAAALQALAAVPENQQKKG